jgi:Trk K+ transport system NAD-binding subunit
MARWFAMTTPSARSEQSGARPVILCGLGRVGLEILCLLERMGETVTVITLRTGPDRPSLAPSERIQVIHGDARDEALLVQAGIEQAKALIAATDDDLVNVTIALHARTRAPGLPVVVRLFDEDLGEKLRTALGIRQGYSSSALAAPAFVAAASGDQVEAAFELAGEQWFVEKRTVAEGGTWVGRTVGALRAAGIVVLARVGGEGIETHPADGRRLSAGDELTILNPCADCRVLRKGLGQRLRGALLAARAYWRSMPRGLRATFYGLLALVGLSVGVFHFALGLSPIDAYYFVVTTLTTTGYGDINLQTAHPLIKLYGTLVMVSGGALLAVLFSMTTDLLLRTRFADVLAQGASHHQGHVIVAGLGRTGFRVLRQLTRLGESVVAIEQRNEAELLGPARSLAPVILGDARARETLARAGLPGAKTVLAVTDDDLANLSIALAAKQARPACRVVARVFDQLLAQRMRNTLGIDAVVSVTGAVAPTFVGSALDPEVVRGVELHGRLLLLAVCPADEVARLDAGACAVLVQGSDGKYRPRTQGADPGGRVLVARWISLAN